jgi:Putative prokaryotic signal transducing protein
MEIRRIAMDLPSEGRIGTKTDTRKRFSPFRRSQHAGRGWNRFVTPVAQEYQRDHDPGMRVVITSNNLVQLSFLTALLADAGIKATVLDNHTSIAEGSAGAIPRRLVVESADFDRACRVLREAGEL